MPSLRRRKAAAARPFLRQGLLVIADGRVLSNNIVCKILFLLSFLKSHSYSFGLFLVTACVNALISVGILSFVVAIHVWYCRIFQAEIGILP